MSPKPLPLNVRDDDLLTTFPTFTQNKRTVQDQICPWVGFGLVPVVSSFGVSNRCRKILLHSIPTSRNHSLRHCRRYYRSCLSCQSYSSCSSCCWSTTTSAIMTATAAAPPHIAIAVATPTSTIIFSLADQPPWSSPLH